MRSAALSPAATRIRAAASWLRDGSASMPEMPRRMASLCTTCTAAAPAGQVGVSHVSERPSSLTKTERVRLQGNWGEHKAMRDWGRSGLKRRSWLLRDPCQFGVPQGTGPRITLCPTGTLSSAAPRAADGIGVADEPGAAVAASENRKSTRRHSSYVKTSYADFCWKKYQ